MNRVLQVMVAMIFSTSSVVHAYCIGGDSCPSSDTDMETFEVCANASTTSCSGTLSVSGNNNITFGTVLVLVFSGGFWQFEPRLAACVSNQVHRLRHSSYRSGNMVNWKRQYTDMAFCAGNGNDTVTLADGTGTCGGSSFDAWDYGTSGYWFEGYGQSGADTIRGTHGNDRMCGGTGNDPLLWGGSGADDLDGWTGDDVLNGYGHGAGDQSWGYTGDDVVVDYVGDPGDAVFGEDDDDCVSIDESITGTEINGGGANCNAGSCTCGTTADDSCSDITGRLLSDPAVIGVESRNQFLCGGTG